VKYNEFKKILYTFFREVTCRSESSAENQFDGSNDADSRKGVPFGGFVDIALHSGGEISPPPKKPNFSGVNRPNWHNIESFVLSKLLH